MYKVLLGLTLLLLVFSSGCNAGQPAGPAAPKAKSPAPHAMAPEAQTQAPSPPGLGVADVVAKLQAKGLKAQATGEKLNEKLLFGASSIEVVSVEGILIQVFVFRDAAAADQAWRTASNPQANTVSWVAEPQFVNMGNLMITVVTTDKVAAARITGALR